MQKIIEHQDQPHLLFIYSKAIIYSARAMAAGTATPEQQTAFMDWLSDESCGLSGLVLIPGSPDLTAFRDGRRFLAIKLRTFLSLTGTQLEELSDENPSERTIEHERDDPAVTRRRRRGGK